MGVFTFVCKSSSEEWTAKQLEGELEGFAASTYELQRKLVQCVAAVDSSNCITSSFSLITPNFTVFQVIIGGGGGEGYPRVPYNKVLVDILIHIHDDVVGRDGDDVVAGDVTLQSDDAEGVHVP
ncbi:60S acidic ribosomal protein family [Theobroma cacao]|uniref:60S acidic ribosomal protein family n=1 Tax=Theobroma cacao TaxID=3641 RepID=A0A061DY85_THECC|nr:60S acidic ribosomal protein family [Theobroma cacao]